MTYAVETSADGAGWTVAARHETAQAAHDAMYALTARLPGRQYLRVRAEPGRQPQGEPSELVRAARDAVTIPRIVAEQALRYVETGDPHGRLRVLYALRRALDAIPETGASTTRTSGSA